MMKMKQFTVISAARARTIMFSILLFEAAVRRRTMASMESFVRLVAISNRNKCTNLGDVRMRAERGWVWRHAARNDKIRSVESGLNIPYMATPLKIFLCDDSDDGKCGRW